VAADIFQWARTAKLREMSFAGAPSTNLTLCKRPLDCRTPKRLRRGVYAELCCEGFYLLAGFFEGAGTVDCFCRVAKFVLDWELCGDAAAGVVIAETAGTEALDLLFGAAPGDYEAV